MTVPAGWPLRPPSGRHSLRFFVAATATGDWAGRAYSFVGAPGSGNVQYSPTPVIRPGDTTTKVNVGSPMGGGVGSPDPNTGAAAPDALTWSGNIVITNDGPGDLDFTFDGTNVHGLVKAGETRFYRERHEPGIAVRGAGGAGTPAFRIESW